MIFSVIYLLVRGLLGCLMVLSRCEASKDAELLLLRHENAVLRRQISRVHYEPGDRLWLAALSRLILCVPITSSTSCDQPILVDHAADVSVSSDAVQVEVDRLG